MLACKIGRYFLILSLALILYVGLTVAQAAAQVIPGDSGNFITTWNTENAGTSNDNQITIPGTGGGYNYDLYWENVASSTQNGTSTVATASHTITFPQSGIYRVEISGDFPRIFFSNGGDKDKILTVEQWGNIAWQSMEFAFFGATNLRIPATDAPDLSNVTSLRATFRDAVTFNDPIDHWTVSSITSLSATFRGAAAFNQPLNSWDVSNVLNMDSVFWGTAFNQPLDNWDVSSLFGLNSTFLNASAFNQDLSSWDVSSVVNMTNLFTGSDLSTENYDKLLNSWSQLTLQNNVTLGADPILYTTDAADARQAIIDTYNWTITDGGLGHKYTYVAGSNATLVGHGTQIIPTGGNGTPVEVIPDSGYRFVAWSDGSTANPRTDSNVTGSLSLTAIVERVTSSGSSGGGNVSRQVQNLEAQGHQEQADQLKAEFSHLFGDAMTALKTPPPIESDPERRQAIIQELIETIRLVLQYISQLIVLLQSEGRVESQMY